jgi:dCTP deaminase
MTVLSDQDLHKELKGGELDISPIDMKEQLQPNSIDIRLGEEISYFLPNGEIVDPKKEISGTEKHKVEKSFVVPPGGFVLGTTEETVSVPNYLEGELKGRSSVGRLGIEVHSTAGLIDSGYSGEITLEITNNNDRPVRLYRGMRIAQIVFHELSSKSENPYSSERNKYQGQEGAVHSRLSEEL